MSYRGHEIDLSKREIVGALRTGELVIDRHERYTHIKGEDLEEALFSIDSQGRGFMVEEVDLGRPTGLARCVETEPEDGIVVAYRLNRAGPTRFALNREPEITTKVTVILKRDERKEGLMILITAWAGGKSEPEPWDPNHNVSTLAASQEFWASHALTLDTEEIDFNRPFGTEEEMLDHLERARFL